MESRLAGSATRRNKSTPSISTMDWEAEHRRRLAMRPNDVASIQALAVLLGQRGDYQGGLRLLERALRIDPHNPSLHDDLGVTHERADNPSAAADCYRRSLHLRPRSSQTWSNLANSLLRLRDFEAAEGACRQAIALDPANVRAQVNLAAALMNIGQVDEALATYRTAIALSPNDPQAHANYGLALLLVGDFTNGWQEYEWRRKLPDPNFMRPGRSWDGSELNGKTILLYGEGGLGNVVQFSRYIPLVCELGGRVIVECTDSLVPILASIAGPEAIIPRGQPLPAYDVHCPLVSLPAIFNHRIDDIPAAVPYLHRTPAQIVRWRPMVRELPGLRVGLCWKGSERIGLRHSRSFDPSNLGPLASVSDISWVHLQAGEQPPASLAVRTLPGLEPQSMQLHDVAAVIQELDLVITCDTSIAHIAGALAVPVWVALRQLADWRWMRARNDTPWYPTMRLIREQHSEDPAHLFREVAELLSAGRNALLSRRSTIASI
jgi:Tfp pilus assembly protein PilF